MPGNLSRHIGEWGRNRPKSRHPHLLEMNSTPWVIFSPVNTRSVNTRGRVLARFSECKARKLYWRELPNKNTAIQTTVCVILSLILSWDFECASFSLHSVLISLPDLLCEPLFNTCSYTERMTSTSRPDLLLFSSWAFSWLEN